MVSLNPLEMGVAMPFGENSNDNNPYQLANRKSFENCVLHFFLNCIVVSTRNKDNHVMGRKFKLQQSMSISK